MSEIIETIKHDFVLPNHDNELSKATDAIEKLKFKLNKILTSVDLINDSDFIKFYEEIVRVLDYVGRLSMPLFAIEEPLEEKYILKYKKSPELAKKLWTEEYEKLHHPYNLLKNRCFKLLEDLDAYYMALYDKNPPNWEI